MRYLLLAALLTGCATSNSFWYKGDRTPDQTAQDELQCDYESRAATANIRSGIEAGYMQADLRNRCMMARGYRRITQ
jgi:hypothetical protein